MTVDSGIKAIVWDLDGTLIDSYRIFSLVLLEVAALHGLPQPSQELMRSNFHGTLEDSVMRALSIEDGPVFRKLIADFLKAQEAHYHQPNDHIFPDALAAVQRAQQQGLVQIIATNRAHQGRGNASPRHLVENSDLRQFISHIVSSDDGIYRKPDSRILDSVLGKTGIRPEEILVIGDQHVDVALAVNLGARSVIIDRGEMPIPHLDLTENRHAHVSRLTTFDDLDFI